jgi:Domain of unknown function (DUF4747)
LDLSPSSVTSLSDWVVKRLVAKPTHGAQNLACLRGTLLVKKSVGQSKGVVIKVRFRPLPLISKNMPVKKAKKIRARKAPRVRYVVAAAINVACHPHPEGCYDELLKIASTEAVGIQVRGPEHIAIVNVEAESVDGRKIYRGEFVKFTKIDISGDWYKSSSGLAADPSEVAAKVIFDPSLYPNASWHPFTFDPSQHIFLYAVVVPKSVARGRKPKALQPSLVEKYFKGLHKHFIDHQLFPHLITVTIVQRHETLVRIWKADRIKKLIIVVKKPNHTEEEWAEDTEELMDAENVNIYTEIRSSATTIVPSEKTKGVARLALKTGHVEAVIVEGTKTEELSTTNHPRIDKRPLSDTEVVIDVLRELYPQL